MIESISISIYDTTIPGIEGNPAILDYAARGSIHWIYEGEDSKFITMMASRLEFDMEVSIEESLNDLVYDYLFTGNETKYSVIMRDQDDNVIWRGFLLPEEYQEPYETGTFFIHITATDGLGRLRGKTLPRSFYRARHSVTKIISDCLLSTGLQLPFSISAGIENYFGGNKWENMYLDGGQWATKEKNIDCYEILNDVLTELGATLFQQNDQWYIIGWNHRGSTGFLSRKYNAKGTPIENYTYQANFKNIHWYNVPTISIKPPFKEISVDVSRSNSEVVIPDWFIDQNVIVDEALHDTEDNKVAFWKSENLTLYLDDVMGNDNPWGEYLGEPLEYVWQPIFWGEFGDLAFPSNLNYFMSLKTRPYIKAGILLHIEMEIAMRFTDTTPIDDINDNTVMYDILIDNEVVISNKPEWPKRDMYKLEFNKQHWPAIGKLSLKDWEVPMSGRLDVRLYHAAIPRGYQTGFKKLDISFSQQKYVYSKRRVTNFSSTREISTFNADSVITLERKAFLYQNEIPESQLSRITFASSGIGYNGNWTVKLSLYEFLRIAPRLDQLYLKRENSDFYEYINEAYLHNSSPGVYELAIYLFDQYKITTNDELYIHTISSEDPQTDLVVNAREQWYKTTHPSGIIRMGDALAEIQHDIYPSSIIAQEGTCKGLVFPGDIWQFELKNKLRNFIPTRIDIMPNENESTVTFLEYKNEKVTDYGG